MIVLASASSARRALLAAAGVMVTVDPAKIDENPTKQSLRERRAHPAAIAENLAVLKALDVSTRAPGALVIGADQTLDLAGTDFDKPRDRAEARSQLQALRGRTHRLFSAVAVVRDGQTRWRHVAEARLTMREFSNAFLEDYLDRAGDSVLSSVGGYQLEGLGAQLFTAIEGDFFTILGLPLLPLLDFLRIDGDLPT
ncbi:Maf family protein [Magnetospirillum molischianum]|uniref:Nucleoside triphosphate pyrophosphatase n=1 Tax=Magnetospirillum molischianum DSM 120 TaxID=1150626 RepID=H8FTF7_MAGML|nr:Maf family protein [Magnetospirillum molischianum]CCG41645.1 putative maf-like protein [Magnetospirillum molischianum DSM 120]